MLEDNPPDASQQVCIPSTMGAIHTIGDSSRRSANLTFQWAPNDNVDLHFKNFYVGYKNQSQLNFFVGPATLATSANTTRVTLNPGTNIVQSINATNLFTLTSKRTCYNTSDPYQSTLGGSWKGDHVTLSTAPPTLTARLTTANTCWPIPG